MKTVDGFRKVPSVAFDTTNNGSSNPWKSTRFTRLLQNVLMDFQRHSTQFFPHAAKVRLITLQASSKVISG